MLSRFCLILIRQRYSTATLAANSETTRPIETNEASFESSDTISSAVSKMVTSGDLGDLGRSHDRFRLLQPFYNTGTTVPIETKMPPVDSAYAISSAVSKMVTSDNLKWLSYKMAAIGENGHVTSQGHQGHLRSPSSKRLKKSYALIRMVFRSSRSVQWFLSYRRAAIGENVEWTFGGHWGHLRSPSSW